MKVNQGKSVIWLFFKINLPTIISIESSRRDGFHWYGCLNVYLHNLITLLSRFTPHIPKQAWDYFKQELYFTSPNLTLVWLYLRICFVFNLHNVMKGWTAGWNEGVPSYWKSLHRISGYQGYQPYIRGIINGFQKKIDQISIEYLADFGKTFKTISWIYLNISQILVDSIRE